MITANCESCSKPFTFEPVQIFGVTFGGPRHCDSCCALAERSESERQVRERESRLAEQWREITKDFPRLAESDPRKIPVPALWEAAMRWDYSTGASVAFVAPYPGAGKTRSAIAACKRAHRSGRSCLIVSAVDFAADASLFGSGRARDLAEERLARARHVAVLLVDDIDKAKWTPRAEEELFSVLDARHRREKPTLWTGNTPTAVLGALWSEERRAAILRRLTDETDIAEVEL